MALLLLPLAAGAEIYKCVKDGSVAYQEYRCDAGSAGVKSKMALANSMTGCYLPLIAGTGWYEVRRLAEPGLEMGPLGNDDEVDDQEQSAESRRYYWRRSTLLPKPASSLWLFRSDRPAGTGTAMRAALMDEIRSASSASGFDLRQGITFMLSPRVHSAAYVVPGIYRGRDAAGSEIYYLHFPPEKGQTSKVVCR